MAGLNKTRSNQMYMDVHLVAMASLAVLNTYLRVHYSTSSLQCKLELQECTGRTFLNDDLRGGRKMAATPRTNKRRKFALWVTFICSLYNLQHWVSKQV